jgi:dihydrofolate reductase
MAKIVAIEHVSLDGVMQAPAKRDEDTSDGFDLGGWAAADDDPEAQKLLSAHMGGAWSLLAGRRTYEHFYKVWPKMPKPNPFTDILNRVDKFVVSNTLTAPLPWDHSHLITGDGAQAIADLKKTHDKTLVIFGSGVLVQALMQRSLVDEFVLQIHPVVLGKGHELFPRGVTHTKLAFHDATPTSTGVIIATYRLQ